MAQLKKINDYYMAQSDTYFENKKLFPDVYKLQKKIIKSIT